MSHQPVMTLAEFDALDPTEIINGYEAARLGAPEPGSDRPQSFWHGWHVHQMAFSATPIPPPHLALAEEVQARLQGGGSG